MTKLTIRLKGGAGSGNFGHKGRPGEVGGSLPAGSSASHVRTDHEILRDRDEREFVKRNFGKQGYTSEEYSHAVGMDLRRARENAAKKNQREMNTLRGKVARIGESWNANKDVFELNNLVKLNYTVVSPAHLPKTENQFYSDVKEWFNRQEIELSDGDWDELGQYFDAWVPELYED
jgi:hypothetical protein